MGTREIKVAVLQVSPRIGHYPTPVLHTKTEAAVCDPIRNGEGQVPLVKLRFRDEVMDLMLLEKADLGPFGVQSGYEDHCFGHESLLT